ncbi:MAG: hypothetical protein MI753_17465 [Hyphomicrobiales bacterium]|nr:hypothetical protein [Hyphomicrobiales bacterium]
MLSPPANGCRHPIRFSNDKPASRLENLSAASQHGPFCGTQEIDFEFGGEYGPAIRKERCRRTACSVIGHRRLDAGVDETVVLAMAGHDIKRALKPAGVQIR